MAGTVRKTVIVTGLVQGVGFRYFTARTARALGVRGTVRNLPGGGVRVSAEGSADAVAALIASLRDGPAGARVTSVTTARETEPGPLPPFTITG